MVDDDNKFDDQFYDDEDAAFAEEFGDFDDEDLEDEFSNELDDEENMSDEDWNEEDFDGSDLIAKDKKGFLPNLNFNTIVISGAVVVGLCVLVFQVMTKKPEIVDTRFRSAVKMQGASEGVVFGDNQVETVEIKAEPVQGANEQIGILEDPTQLDSMDTTMEEAPPMPVSISAETVDDEKILLAKDFSANKSLKEELMGEAEVTEPMAEDTSATLLDDAKPIEGEVPRMPNESQDQENQDVAVDAIPAENQPALDVVVQPALVGDTENNATESDPILPAVEMSATDDITTSDDGQITALSEDVPIELSDENVIREPAVSINTDNNLTEITDRLAVMETKIGGLEERFENQPAVVPNDDIKQLNETVAELQKEIARLKGEAQKKAASAPKKSSSQKTVSKKPAVPKATKVASTQWELRAAQPGKAWVSQKGKSDLQPVVVGDILSGLGRIQSISYMQGKWVVQATSGQIRQ